MDCGSSIIPNLFAINEYLRSKSRNSPGLVFLSSDTGDEFTVAPPRAEPIDLKFRTGGPTKSNDTFINENAGRLFAVSETGLSENSVIDIAGTDIER